MRQIILFISIFSVVYMLYFLFVISRAKSLNKWKNGRELSFLKYRYKLNYKKINIKALGHVIALSNAFIISTVVIVISLFKNFLLQMLLGVIMLVPFILIVYHIIGKIYQNKQRRK